jgi:arylsulfatase A-like enzyme
LAAPTIRSEAGSTRWVAAAISALCLCSCADPAPPERIVLIVIDTLRRDFLSYYGDAPLPTPHIDALARRGRAYERVTAAYHQTSMSMAALFTGRTPSIERPDGGPPLPWTGQTWCGMARFAAPGEELCIPTGLTTLAERLRGAGYWTIGVMSNHMLFEPSGFGRGFDDRSEVGQRPPEVGPLARYRVEEAWRERTARHVNRAAREALARRPNDRFFLYVHYMDVHDWGYRAAPYAQSVAIADAAVGALLGDLDRAGLLVDAVVILTSDHGEHLGETHPPDPSRVMRSHQGNPSYQELLRVPLVVAPDSRMDARELLRTQDLYGEILRIAGLPAAPSDLEDGELFVGEQRFLTYRRGRFKSSFERRGGREVLFDLLEDPREQQDLAGSRPELLEEHRRKVVDLQRRLGGAARDGRELSEDDRRRLDALGYVE